LKGTSIGDVPFIRFREVAMYEVTQLVLVNDSVQSVSFTASEFEWHDSGKMLWLKGPGSETKIYADKDVLSIEVVEIKEPVRHWRKPTPVVRRAPIRSALQRFWKDWVG
jgi:hypothetical protein